MLTNRTVAAGDVIMLQLTRSGSFGDYSGVNFTITFESAFQPRITLVENLTNNLRITFMSQPGKSYAIQSTSNLLQGLWLTLPGTTNLAVGTVLQTTLTNAFMTPQQFYHVWQLP